MTSARRVIVYAIVPLAMTVDPVSPRATVSAQSSETGILERLTAETHAQALACGRAGPQCSVTPYELCASNGRYAARLATPFSRVASAATDAAKSGRRLDRVTPGFANRWGVGIFVYPADNSASADAIQRLEIRRQGQTIKPATSTVGPLTISNADGSTKQLSRGFFAFKADAFAPTADTTVVFVGGAGETTCVLDRGRLAALR
jgi:hypothetical protein